MRRPLLLAAVLACASISAVASAQTAPAGRKAPAKKKAPVVAPRKVAAAAEAPKPPPLPPAPDPPPSPPYASPGPPTTATAGATLLPEVPVATAAPVQPGMSAEERASLEGRLRMIEARLATDEQALVNNPELAWLRRFHLSGYLQPQVLIESYNTAASPNLINGSLPPGVSANDSIARSNGTTTNSDLFRVRRARLRTEFMPSEGTRLVFEIDPTPPNAAVGSPTTTILRTVEAQGIAAWSDAVTTEFAAGIFKLPFGAEVLQSDAERPFIERSWGEQNMTPGEFDTGARMYTTWSKDGRTLAVQLALVNGQTIGEPTFALQPGLNQGKDGVGRINFDFGDWVDLGVSGYGGAAVEVNAPELRFKQFMRWAVNGELGLHHTFSPSVGATKILAEVTFAQNFDRGVYYSYALPVIPASITAPVVNLNERNVWVRLEQDLTHWATLGLRWDEYTPNTSIGNDARDTFAIVAAIHFTPWLQTMLEYSHAIDHVHPAAGQYTDKQIETGSGVLQAKF
jgi:hypothetical protein